MRPHQQEPYLFGEAPQHPYDRPAPRSKAPLFAGLFIAVMAALVVAHAAQEPRDPINPTGPLSGLQPGVQPQ